MLPHKKKISKIGVFRALQLGDLLCCIPAVRALKGAFPQADIWLIGLPGASAFTRRFHRYFSGLIPFPGYPGLPEQPYNIQAVVRFIHSMQRAQFDLILQMQGNGTLVNPLVELLGARNTAGFFREGDYRPPSDLFMAYPDREHEINRHLLLMHHLGIHDATDPSLEFPLSQEDEYAFEKQAFPVRPGSYVCVHPGSRGKWRQWPPAYFAALADDCLAQGKQIVITGTAEERPIALAVAEHMKGKALIAAGKTDLGAMGVLVRNAYGIISNCTGISHMAAALGTPGIIISMDGAPQRWGPLNKALFYTLDWTRHPDRTQAHTALAMLLKERCFSPGLI